MVCTLQQLFLLLVVFGVYHAQANDVCSNETKDRSPSSPSVAIIGCGPSGIAFLHAINLKRKEMEEKGDLDGLSKLPIATCFERASEPGGVWKANRDHSPSGNEANSMPSNETTNMYEGLWTNGAKELFEFFDYTFEDHYNQSLPAYVPRQFVLDYILKRVERNEPDFFSHARFNTEVEFVQFDETTNQFNITIRETNLQKTSTVHFDKCIWAAGTNGLQAVPKSIENVLQKGKFQGTVMHSSSAGDVLSDSIGKRILMIGDAYSAEDLTLQALKLGVEMVYILSRSSAGICLDAVSWPKGDVHILESMALSGVLDGGHGLRFTETHYDRWEEKYMPNDVTTDIEDISAVIYCTGYEMDTSMLDAPLIDAFTRYNKEGFVLEEDLYANWAMSSNSFTESLGDVEPEDWVYSHWASVYPGHYRGLLISNPNMMYMMDGISHIPLLDCDVQAWLLLAHIVGDLDTPSADEMILWNTQTVAKHMQIPISRYQMDLEYKLALMDKVDDEDDRYYALSSERERLVFMQLAQDMRDGSIPHDLGTAEKLNEKGELILKMKEHDHHARWLINPEDSDWKTFRDGDPSGYVSIHTGNVAAPLEKRWIDIDETEMLVV